MLFDVRVLAFDAAAPDPVTALMRVFKVDHATAQELVQKLPRVVKRNVPIETARRLSQVLTSIGASTEVFASASDKRPGAEREELAQAKLERAHRAGQELLRRYALPEPNHMAIGSALGMHPANANAVSTSSSATGLVAVQLQRVRASAGMNVTEVTAESAVQRGHREVGADSARFLRSSPAHEPSFAAVQEPVRPSDALEADIAPPPRVSQAPRNSQAPRTPRVSQSLEPRRPLTHPAFAALIAPELSGDPLGERKRALPGTRGLLIKASLLTTIMLLSLSVITLGMLPVLLLGCWLFDACKRWSLQRSIRSSAVQVWKAQLPELHACTKQLGERLALRAAPRLYVANCAQPGVSTTVFRGQVTLLLSAETLREYVQSDRGQVLAFVLAHELSAVALGQHGRTRAFLAWLWPAVRKADVLSADALAQELTGDRAAAESALLTLLMGRASQWLDRADLARQAESHEAESQFYAPALPGQSEFLLARLHRARRTG